MKFYFLDTSALVKRYHSEKGTAEIDEIFSEEDKDDGHIKDSVALVLKHGLRTLDALQLAVAIGLKDAKPIFVCADKKLVSIAEKEGLKTINPENKKSNSIS